MKSFELDVVRTLPRRACHWLNLGTLLCLSWAITDAAPTVELLRDPWGTPHIFATTEIDGFFGLGYAAAQDRLLQMELIRRKAAVRRGGRLELFVDGRKTAESPALSSSPLDVTNDQPLRLGAGETDSFSGRIREVRLYRRALSGETLRRLAEPR